MKKKLFLDDLRTVDMVYAKSKVSDFDVVRCYEGFVKYIELNGLPEFISFDNDLGLDESGKVAPDGLAAAKWLVYESGLDLSHLKFRVHSANPVAAEQIRGLLSNYINFLNKSNDSSKIVEDDEEDNNDLERISDK
ncbi:cyclic-phosphate processing receiver domain-containing protein [Formosa sp. A9]|uniref:cyclic-phosphate processing receiver domain-containing protein n=1 Tax=Formosa sp. A9 TaxID=3442641 RepID=UPI003EBAF2DE